MGFMADMVSWPLFQPLAFPRIAVFLFIFLTSLIPIQPLEKPRVPIHGDCDLVH